jgi:hypothetical protein
LKIEALRSVETSVFQKHRALSHQIRILFHHHIQSSSNFNNFRIRCPVYTCHTFQHYPSTGDPCDNLKLRTEIYKIVTFLPSSGTHQQYQIQGDGHVALLLSGSSATDARLSPRKPRLDPTSFHFEICFGKLAMS